MRSGYDKMSEWINPYYTDLFKEIIDLRFRHRIFEKGPALISEDGTLQQYLGQPFDPESSRLEPDGWTHEHCEVCSFTINEGHTYWVNDDGACLCDTCYEYFVRDRR